MEVVPDSTVLAPERRNEISTRLAALASRMTTEAVTRMAERHPWYSELDADTRASVTLVVRSGVDGFVTWFSAGAKTSLPDNIFGNAPRSLQRQISLQQTVSLIRSVIDTVEEQITTVMPESDRGVLQLAIVQFSREVAFDAAEVYARAAEARGAWDARLEALVMDAVLRGDADESMVARASTLGWRDPQGLVVIIGDPLVGEETSEAMRSAAARAGLSLLAAPQGDRMAVLLGGDFTESSDALTAAAVVTDGFGAGPIVVGPVVSSLAAAPSSARAAMAGRRAAHAWPTAPRPVSADDLLPERALAGDGHARRMLAQDIFQRLSEHSGDLLDTLETYLAEGSIEGAARHLFIHANTVRYRLARVENLTGYDPSHPRDRYILRMGITLGRLFGSATSRS